MFSGVHAVAAGTNTLASRVVRRSEYARVTERPQNGRRFPIFFRLGTLQSHIRPCNPTHRHGRLATRFDIPLKFDKSDVSSRTVLLRFDGPVAGPVIDLRPAHAQNLACFGNLKAKRRKWAADVRYGVAFWHEHRSSFGKLTRGNGFIAPPVSLTVGGVVIGGLMLDVVSLAIEIFHVQGIV